LIIFYYKKVEKLPKLNDIQSILIIGSGPFFIGQACDFDYSGTKACIALGTTVNSVKVVN